jgi:hypothetical protein
LATSVAELASILRAGGLEFQNFERSFRVVFAFFRKKLNNSGSP